MTRHPTLVPLTHDHHHALAAARGLRLAASSGDPARLEESARSFLDFFARDTLTHFHEEEEIVFPLLLERSEEPPEELLDVLVQHVRIHGLATRLRAGLEQGSLAPRDATALAELLQAHIRLEERRLFPLIEQTVEEERLNGLRLSARRRDAAPSLGTE